MRAKENGRVEVRKNQRSLPRLKAEAERIMGSIILPISITFYMDGSVDPIAHTTGTGFVARDIVKSIKVTDNTCSGLYFPKGGDMLFTFAPDRLLQQGMQNDKVIDSYSRVSTADSLSR